MKKIKKIKKICLGVTFVLGMFLSACGNKEASNENKAGNDAETTMELKLGHNLAEDHAVHIALTEFKKEVEEESKGSLKINIFPNGTLGSETDMINQIQSGALDMAKVSAATLGNFSEDYNVFSVPYVFRDKDHYYKVMDSDIVKSIFDSTESMGFKGLTWLDSGARSFYTANKAIRKPEDLKGLKIRTMDSKMAIAMMDALGGSSTVMGYSDIYTALQSGVIDGAENNITALRDHGEVSKYYCFDEHTRIPDIVIVSSAVWNKMTDEQKEIFNKASENMKEKYKKSWDEFEKQVRSDVESKHSVEFITDVDKDAFVKAVQPVYDNLEKESPEVFEKVQQIINMK